MRDLLRMMESEAPKPKFKRRGVVLSAAGLALVLAVALVAFGGTSTGSVRTTLMRFEKSDDKSLYLAVFYLTNETAMDFVLLDSFVRGTVLGRFHSATGKEEDWLGEPPNAGFTDNRLNAHSSRVARVELPKDGRKGRVELYLAKPWRVPAGPLGRLRHWWQSKLPHRENTPRALCSQEIQCPLVLPDGTVQPPRRLSSSKGKQ